MSTPIVRGDFFPAPRSDEMPAKPYRPRLARIFLGAGLLLVVLLFGPVVQWLVPPASPGRATGERAASAPPIPEPQDKGVDAEASTLEQEHVWVIPTAAPAAAEEKRPLAPTATDTARKEPTPPPLPPSAGYEADRAFEQRLEASEEDLRSQLGAVAEVRLLSDAEVLRIRAAQRAAQEAVPGSPAAVEAAQRNVRAVQSELQEAQRNGLPRYAYDEICGRYKEIVQAYKAVVLASQDDGPARLRQQERIDGEFNLRLHQDLARAAVGAGLTLQAGPDCQLDQSTAAQMAVLSRELRIKQFVTVPGLARVTQADGRALRSRNGRGVQIIGNGVSTAASEDGDDASLNKVSAFQHWCDRRHLESKPGTAPTLTQMLQVENEATRLLLVRELTRIDSEEATTSLAVRAIADLSPAVRQAAVAGLQGRSWQHYGPVLLRGLRYPWAPVADHAAIALRTLAPPEAIAPLVRMLDLPSPSRPFLDAATHRYAVREVVRINHLRSCLLCHAPSANRSDGLVRGLVPTPGEALPVTYYEAVKGNFVRADLTYLRQDFSVTLPDDNAAPWPREQRYDFLSRVRHTLTSREAVQLSTWPAHYSQREAVLYALRGLTGRDGGSSSARWRELLGQGVSKPEEKPRRPVAENIAVSTTAPNSGRP